MKQKKKSKVSNALGYFLMLLPFLVVGGYLARAVDSLIPDETKHAVGIELMLLGFLIIIMVFLYLLHIILHEAGHLLAGLVMRYEFLSFRVGSLTLVKRDGKLQWKKTTLVGTGGQCLMLPPQCEPKNCPFTLYLLGGGLINVVLGLIGFVIAIPVDGIAECIWIIFGIVGIGIGLTNLIPLTANGMANDGYQLFIEIPGNPKAKEMIYCLLSANAMLTDLESTKDLPDHIKNYIMETDYSNLADVSTANLLSCKNLILLEEEKYEEFRKNCERLVAEEDVLELFKNEAICDLIYLELMEQCDGEKIDTLMDKKQMEYIKATALYPSRKMLMYAYYGLYKKDMEKANKEYEGLLKVCKSHPIKAECNIAMMQAERIKTRIESME